MHFCSFLAFYIFPCVLVGYIKYNWKQIAWCKHRDFWFEKVTVKLMIVLTIWNINWGLNIYSQSVRAVDLSSLITFYKTFHVASCYWYKWKSLINLGYAFFFYFICFHSSVTWSCLSGQITWFIWLQIQIHISIHIWIEMHRQKCSRCSCSPASSRISE